MAASMWNVFLRKSSQIFQVEYGHFVKNSNPAFIRLGLFLRCYNFQQKCSSSLHHRLYCATQTFQLDHPHLPLSVWRTPLRSLSTITNEETSEGINTEGNMEELDKLYKTVELRVKGHDDAVLDSYEMFVSMAAKELGVTVQSVSKPLRKIKRLTLLKSRHIYKKHRVQYEMRTYFRIIELKHLTGSTADVFLEYVERNLPEGVALKVTKCALETIPDHLHSPPEESAESSPTSSASSASSSTSSSTSSSEDEDEDSRHIRE